MGMLAVIELANNVEAGSISLAEAVGKHFATSFVKPIRDEWISVCVSIIKQYQGGDHDLSYKIHAPGKPDDVLVTAESIIEDLHLDPFVGEAGCKGR